MTRRVRPIVMAVLLGMLGIPGQGAQAQGPQSPQCTLVVIPTLGGPSNYWQNPGAVFNNQGMVALFGWGTWRITGSSGRTAS